MSGPTLEQRFDPRHNSLSTIRLGLAACVALVHAQALGWGDQPRLGRSQIGNLAVDGFFVISGFLVTRSATRLPSLRRFAWHRALRIMPGFWVCLVMVAGVAAPLLAWLEGLSPAVVWSGPDSAVGYVTRNAGLLIRQWDIAGLSRGADPAVDGSLWTLFYEACCYAVVGLLMAIGVIRRRTARDGRMRAAGPALHRRSASRAVKVLLSRHLVVVLTLAVWVVQVGQCVGIDVVGSRYLSRFLLLFLLGALGHLYAHRIQFPIALLAGAGVVLTVALASLEDYRPVGAVAFAYLFLWTIVALPLRWEPPVDLSYGIYVYHWPVTQVLAQTSLPSIGRVGFTLACLAVVGPLAWASWLLVEAPALRHKNAAWIDRLALIGGPTRGASWTARHATVPGGATGQSGSTGQGRQESMP